MEFVWFECEGEECDLEFSEQLHPAELSWLRGGVGDTSVPHMSTSGVSSVVLQALQLSYREVWSYSGSYSTIAMVAQVEQSVRENPLVISSHGS